MNKILLTFIVLSFSCTDSYSQSVAINTDGSTADASALLDVKSTAKGVLIPRVSSTQRNAISTPANGLLVFDTDSNCVFFYSSAISQWKSMCDSASSTATPKMRAYLSGSNITANYAGDVDIVLNSKNYDVGNNYNTSTGKYTVPADGYYQINATIYLINPPAGFIHLQISNPTNVISASSANGGSGNDVQVSHSDLLYLQAGELISLNLHFGAGVATVGALGTNNLAITFMSIYRVN